MKDFDSEFRMFLKAVITFWFVYGLIVLGILFLIGLAIFRFIN